MGACRWVARLPFLRRTHARRGCATHSARRAGWTAFVRRSTRLPGRGKRDGGALLRARSAEEAGTQVALTRLRWIARAPSRRRIVARQRSEDAHEVDVAWDRLARLALCGESGARSASTRANTLDARRAATTSLADARGRGAGAAGFPNRDRAEGRRTLKAVEARLCDASLAGRRPARSWKMAITARRGEIRSAGVQRIGRAPTVWSSELVEARRLGRRFALANVGVRRAKRVGDARRVVLARGGQIRLARSRRRRRARIAAARATGKREGERGGEKCAGDHGGFCR